MDAHNSQEHHEIIIIKKHHDGDHDAPHGGAWKVAFADFMTAMMAFFLVLWIVNSTTKETRSSLARYFNPVQLSDTTPARKGVKDPKDDESDRQDDSKMAPPKAPENAPKDPHAKSDPHEGPSETDPNKKNEEKSLPPKSGAESEKQEKPKTASEATKSEDKAKGKAAADAENKIAAYNSGQKDNAKKEEAKAQAGNNTALKAPEGELFSDPFDRRNQRRPGEDENQKNAENAQNDNDINANEAKPNPEAKKAAEESAKRAANSMRTEIASQLAKEDLARLGGALEVKAEPEGILISLIDRSDYGMFAVGSAEPDPLLLHALDAIGHTIQKANGAIVIRGHTDARRYRGGAYDNWQLSSARAQSAFHVLLKKGLDEKKVERIEGYADRKLRRPENPDAPENRRIEILVRKVGA